MGAPPPVISTGAPQSRHFDRSIAPPRHFDRSEASGEIRPATDAGQALKPWASMERGPDFSTPPRIKSGAPVEKTGRGKAAPVFQKYFLFLDNIP